MKEFEITQMYGGIQLHVIVVANTKKNAAKLLDVSLYRLNTWSYCNEPKTPEAIKEPYKLWAYFDSGWLREFKPTLYKKVIPFTQLKQIINECNKIRFSKSKFRFTTK